MGVGFSIQGKTDHPANIPEDNIRQPTLYIGSIDLPIEVYATYHYESEE